MATKLDVVKDFIDISGRRDLVVDLTNYVDTSPLGASYFVDAALRWLDSLVTHRKIEAELKEDLAQGDFQLNFPDARAIKGLRVIDAGLTDGTTEVEKVSREALHRMYAITGPLSSVVEGRPKHYAIDILRDGAPTVAKVQQQGVVFMPPCDKAYSLFVRVLHYSASLDEGEDKNFWSLLYPDLLVRAMMRMLSAHYQNTAGVRDWEIPILNQLDDIDRDQVETDSAEITHMQDSWRFEW